MNTSLSLMIFDILMLHLYMLLLLVKPLPILQWSTLNMGDSNELGVLHLKSIEQKSINRSIKMACE